MLLIVSFASLLLFFHQTEAAVTALTSTPANPSTAIETRELTLMWNYTLDGAVFLALFSNVTGGGNDEIARKLQGKNIRVGNSYNDRISAGVSDTHAWLKIVRVKRSDQGKYRLFVTASVYGSFTNTVDVIVQYPANFINVSGNQTVREGLDLQLFCEASGKPDPNITWTKISQRGSESSLLNRGLSLDFEKIRRTDAGTYRCKASNGVGNQVAHAIGVTVLYKPENVHFMSNVTSDKACQNDIVKFNCTADANPAVTYQLLKNDTTAETSSTGMWIKTLSSSGLFIYKCMANNTIGTASSMSSVSITVNEPSYIPPILDRNITEGKNLTLTCQESGTPPLTVSWIKVGGQRINDNVLQLTNISKNEAGNYRCETSNECGNSSEPVNINVQYKPENVQLTANVTANKVCQNDIVKFNCSADANPIVTSYQLFKNDTAPDMSSSGMWNKTLSSSGLFIYQCVANNTIGTASSTSVPITVNVPSSIPAIPDQIKTEGENLTLTCQASGTPPLTVSWIKVGGQRTNGNVLELINISRNDAGDYKCDASNECGNSSEAVNINVQYPPSITDISDTQRLTVGATVTLNCTADGNPAAYMTWTKVSDGSVVTFPLNITGKQYEGAYTCTADNGVGSNSDSVSIIVHFPASIVPLEETKRVTKGGSISLFCNVTGQPVPSVTWTHIDTGKRVNNKTWVIDNIGESDLGEYQCKASNIYENATDSTKILFEGDRCEKKCTSGQNCLPIGSFYSCLCEKGKKGTNCEQTETLKKVVEARFTFKNQEYKEEYNNLEDPVTIKFVKYIEWDCTEEYKANSKGLKFKKCKVTKLSRGSVIADMGLQFDEDVSESQIRVLTQKITEDKSLGQLKVGSFNVGPTSPPKPALIALCAVAGVVVLALLVAIIACSLHKKKRGGQSFSNGEYGQPRHEPEGHGRSGERNGVNGVRMAGGNHYDNTAYEQEMQPPTPMVTFTNPSQTPGITVSDSSVTKKAQPGEGTYADLGEFRQKAATPTGPVKMPPAYEETPYAEITQFLQGPVATNEETQEEKSVELKKPDDWNNSSEANESNDGNLYPVLDTDNRTDQSHEEIVVTL